MEAAGGLTLTHTGAGTATRPSPLPLITEHHITTLDVGGQQYRVLLTDEPVGDDGTLDFGVDHHAKEILIAARVRFSRRLVVVHDAVRLALDTLPGTARKSRGGRRGE